MGLLEDLFDCRFEFPRKTFGCLWRKTIFHLGIKVENAIVNLSSVHFFSTIISVQRSGGVYLPPSIHLSSPRGFRVMKKFHSGKGCTAKIFQKNSYPIIRSPTCTCQGVRNVSLSSNFAYALHGWSLAKNWQFL